MAISDIVKIIVSAEDRASGVLGGIGGALQGVGKFALGLAGGAVTAGLAGLGAGLAVAIDEGMEAEANQAQLLNVLKSTGGAAGVTAEMAGDLAGALAGVTKFSDDAVLSGENILLTFTGIGKDIFPDVTETMLDVSQAMGQDIKSSAIQLGKALNDPVAGLAALSRVGVSFTDEQKEMVKGLVESGDTLSAQKIILAELQKEFGGSAKAAGETFGGQLEILKNSLLNVAETAGMSLIPILTTGLQAITPVITDLANKLAEFLQSEGFKQFLADASAFLAERLIPAILDLVNWLSVNLPPAIQIVTDVWNTYLRPALEWLGTFLVEQVFPALAEMGEWFSEKIPAFLATLREAWDSDFAGIKTIATTFIDGLKELWAALQALFRGDFEGFGQHIRNMVDGFFRAVGDLLIRAMDWIASIDWGSVGMNIVIGIANGIIAFQDWAFNAIIGLGQGVLLAIKGFLGIRSPSTVFADQIGAPMAQGLAQGFKRALPDLKGIVSDSLSSPLPAVRLAGISGAGLIGQRQQVIIAPTINYRPFISTLDEAEAVYRLKPIIAKAVR